MYKRQVVELFHQQPLAAHRVQRWQQKRPQQFLRCDRRSPGFGIQLVEPWFINVVQIALTAPGISRSCSSSANLSSANASRTSTWHVSRDAVSRKPPASRPASCGGVRICSPSTFPSAARKRSSCQARRPGTTMVLRVIDVPRQCSAAIVMRSVEDHRFA